MARHQARALKGHLLTEGGAPTEGSWVAATPSRPAQCTCETPCLLSFASAATGDQSAVGRRAPQDQVAPSRRHLSCHQEDQEDSAAFCEQIRA